MRKEGYENGEDVYKRQALYFTAFVVGGIYQALETERTMTVKIFLLFLAGIYGTLYTCLLYTS